MGVQQDIIHTLQSISWISYVLFEHYSPHELKAALQLCDKLGRVVSDLPLRLGVNKATAAAVRLRRACSAHG